jgi:hypothetical protein
MMDGGRSTRALVQGEDVRGKSQELSQLRVFGTDNRRQIYPCEECRRSRSGMRAEAHAHDEEQVRGPPRGASAREATSSGCRRSLRGV